MGFAGFGGAPVYVVLPSPGGGVVPPTDTSGPHLQELLRNLPYTPSSRGVTIYELPEGSNQQAARVSCVGAAHCRCWTVVQQVTELPQPKLGSHALLHLRFHPFLPAGSRLVASVSGVLSGVCRITLVNGVRRQPQ